jgi:hypothetical protein
MSSHFATALSPLIPAKAGIQGERLGIRGIEAAGQALGRNKVRYLPWVPAFAGTSEVGP